MRRAPTRRWKQARDELRKAIERRGYDRKRGVFVQAFDRPELDAALLLLPTVEFVAWDDERMVRTADEVRGRLDLDGLLRRHDADDGMPEEGAFLACSFWVVEALARAGRADEAAERMRDLMELGGPTGLYSEEAAEDGTLLGNLPQALTHLSLVNAANAIADAGGGRRRRGRSRSSAQAD
jgi:GH15 family glucan-1,4-alpha-glucosidase